MKLIESAKELISKSEARNITTDFVEDLVSALMGDKLAIGKIIYTLMQSPMFFREQLFWSKFEKFLNGIDTSAEEHITFYTKLDLEGKNKDNAYRLIHIIDRLETQRKVSYLVNASKCLVKDLIGQATYFRICHAIASSLEEDLNFLKDNILKDAEFEYGDNIQGLMNNGLMYQSAIVPDGDDRYNFTSLAKALDCYALSYNTGRYSIYKRNCINTNKKRTEVDVVARFG